MILNKQKNNKGFTIIEALASIFILTISVLAMLSLTASSASSARYANNELTANYLLQEAIDSIRNSRDTIAFLQKDTTGGWQEFKDRYGGGSLSKCFTSSGCLLKIENFDADDLFGNDIASCNPACQALYYDSSASSLFYQYTNNVSVSNFTRTVKMTNSPGGDSVKVEVIVDWLNGVTPRTQTMEMSLFNWQQ